MSDERLLILRRLPELAPYTERELAGLLPHLDEVVVGPGVRLATHGRPAGEYLVVLDGEVEACGAAGRRRLIPGDSAGWPEMCRRSTNAETLVTVSPTRLLVMSRAQFRAIRALGDRQAAAASLPRMKPEVA